MNMTQSRSCMALSIIGSYFLFCSRLIHNTTKHIAMRSWWTCCIDWHVHYHLKKLSQMCDTLNPLRCLKRVHIFVGGPFQRSRCQWWWHATSIWPQSVSICIYSCLPQTLTTSNNHLELFTALPRRKRLISLIQTITSCLTKPMPSWDTWKVSAGRAASRTKKNVMW